MAAKKNQRYLTDDFDQGTDDSQWSLGKLGNERNQVSVAIILYIVCRRAASDFRYFTKSATLEGEISMTHSSSPLLPMPVTGLRFGKRIWSRRSRNRY